MDDSGGSGGTIASNYGAPTMDLILSSGGTMVGGLVTASLLAPGNMDVMQSVTWTITGAESGQSYTNASGQTSDITGPVVDTWGGGGVAFDTKIFYWNASAGNHTVSVQVTYTDGSTATVTPQTVSVDKPNVTSFTVVPDAVFWDTTVVPSKLTATIQYGASVSEPANDGGQGGIFALIQKVSRGDSVIDLTGANAFQHHTLSTGGFVLDNSPAVTDPNSPNGIFVMGGTDTQTTVAPGQPANIFGTVTDEPGLEPTKSITDIGCYGLTMNAQFMDYLVYRPAAGGIWVELSETPAYTLTGTAQWVDQNGNLSKTIAGGKWQTSNLSPLQPPVEGTNTPNFVSWTNYVTNASQWTPPLV